MDQYAGQFLNTPSIILDTKNKNAFCSQNTFSWQLEFDLVYSFLQRWIQFAFFVTPIEVASQFVTSTILLRIYATHFPEIGSKCQHIVDTEIYKVPKSQLASLIQAILGHRVIPSTVSEPKFRNMSVVQNHIQAAL